MYIVNLNKDLTIDSVSQNFKALMGNQAVSLKNCFFLSMVDCAVPDQLAEDLYASLDKGLVYNATLKVNVLQIPSWFDVSIAPRFIDGSHVGFQANLTEAHSNDIQTTTKVYRKILRGDMSMKHGWPVETHKITPENSTERWSNRVK